MDSYKKSRRKSIIAWVIAFVLAIGAAIVSFTPFIFMVLNSFKEKFEMLTKGVFQLPDQLNWSNYTEVLTGGFANYFKNSVIVLAISLILLLFISACASYPLARFKFKMAQPIYAIIVACMSIPVHITLIPVFKMSKSTGLYDTIWSLIKRHLNEYTSLDFEMGYIDSFEEIMAMETGFLQYAMNLLKTEYAKEVQILKLEIPDVSKIPAVRFDVAKELVSQKYNRKIRNPFDLEPEEEALIGQYFREEYGSDFVFVTHYPSKKRPFYAMDDPEDARFTLSFDLLFKGLEITTGGQRIHDYNMLVQKIEDRGMTQEGMEQYLDTFKHGMPPHGGLGIGLERLTMQLLGEENVREACLFPRDLNRLEP